MGHLDTLHEEKSEQGLSVVAITKQDRSAVNTFIGETEAKHPIVIESTDSMRAYGRTSYPSAFLIGTNGRILWLGHPGSLKDEFVDEQLAEAKILPAFPKALKSAKKALAKDRFADARKKVEKALAGSALEENDRQAGEQIRDWIDWYASSTVEAAGQDAQDGDLYAAWEAYEEIAKAYKGLDVAAEATAAAKALLADKAQKKEIDAGRKLAKIKREIADLSPKKAIKALQALVGKKYGETKAGREAAELIEHLEHTRP